MSKLQTPFRYDFVGSFLRPQALKDAKAAYRDGKITKEEFDKVVNEEISQVQQMENVDSDQLFIQGESQGGFVGAYVAAQIPEKIKGLILWYPAFVIPDDAKRRFEENDNTCFGQQLSPDYNKVAKDIDIFNVITGYKGPVVIIHGESDNCVPISYSEHAEKVYDNVKLIRIPSAGHGFDGKDSQFAREQSIEFIKKNLK